MPGRNYGSIHIESGGEAPDTAQVTRRHPQHLRLVFSLIAGTAGLILVLLLAYNTPASVSMQVSAIVNTQKEAFQPTAHKDPEYYYKKQLVDHFSSPHHHHHNKHWNHRYYASAKYFGGPGHPIFMVLGGEGPANGLFYPFINEHLAKTLKAYVLQPEHRFYGKSQPILIENNEDFKGLHTVEQAMADFLRILKHKQEEIGCSKHRDSDHYCPVITVGGSYPGFLSTMMRFVHPEHIDIAYAASAPLHLYSQDLDPNAYYEKVTEVAEKASPGCAESIKATLTDIVSVLEDPSVSFVDVAKQLGICTSVIPEYITTNEIFSQEIMMIAGDSFADLNMDYYPPGNSTTLAQACHIFQNEKLDSYQRLGAFYKTLMDDDDYTSLDKKDADCFDLHSQMPAGPRSTVSTADWSGAGPGETGRSWEFQLCSQLVVRTGFSNKTMFIPREWSLDWLTQHCQSRYGVTPEPYGLVDKWHFDDLVAGGASRILFTNGDNDGWSVLSYLKSLSNSVVAINFPNGAHHSDLSHVGPSDKDTEDIQHGFAQITNLLRFWLAELKHEAR